ncbi:MAG: hypothetical protein ACRDJ2_13755 [Actinomycetota bacterium]
MAPHETVQVVEAGTDSQLREAVELAEKAAAQADRYVEAIERISAALDGDAPVNRAKLVIAALSVPRGED